MELLSEETKIQTQICLTSNTLTFLITMLYSSCDKTGDDVKEISVSVGLGEEGASQVAQ